MMNQTKYLLKNCVKALTTPEFRWKSQLHLGRWLQRAERWLGREPTASRHALVSFSYLFRDIRDYVGPITQEFSQFGEPIRILSAGCATGQEAYSIAIICHARGIPVSIVGIDLSPHAIQVAAQGRYALEQEKLRSRAEDTLEAADHIDHYARYFVSCDKTTHLREVHPDIKRLVRFEVADVCQLPFDGEFDFVVCRKMLYYLLRAEQVRALKSLLLTLKSGQNETHLIIDDYTRKQSGFEQVLGEALAGFRSRAA